MFVNPVQYNVMPNKKTPDFGSLIVDKSAVQVIKNMSGEDIAEFKKIEKRLSKSKFWDLKIYGAEYNKNAFKFVFIHKDNKHEIIESGISPYNKKDNTISIYSLFRSGGKDAESTSVVETLKFKSAKIASHLYETYQKSVVNAVKKHWILTPIENLKNRELQLKMLEKGFKSDGKINFIDTGYHTKNTIGNM